MALAVIVVGAYYGLGGANARLLPFLMAGLGLTATPARPEFDVSAIKPAPAGTREGMTIQPGGRFWANNFAFEVFLIATANHIPVFQILGADGW